MSYKNILLQFNDNELKLVTEEEFSDMEDKCLESDEPSPYTYVGELVKVQCTQISALHYSELKFAVHLANSVVGELEKFADANLKTRIEKFKVAVLSLEGNTVERAQEIFKLIKDVKVDEEKK